MQRMTKKEVLSLHTLRSLQTPIAPWTCVNIVSQLVHRPIVVEAFQLVVVFIGIFQSFCRPLGERKPEQIHALEFFGAYMVADQRGKSSLA